MQIVESIQEWQKIRQEIPAEKTIGFIPTMGNLHAGHLSIIKKSLAENDITIVSIFINPTQFNNPDDLKSYPRTIKEDIEFLQKNDVDFLLHPHYEELYHDHYNYQVHESKLSTIMEGKKRPGHFNGVLTIVLKLLMLTRPTRTYFGEKDYQQLKLIEAMADAFFINTTIIGCPLIREPSGLACSSRNNLLNPKQRETAELFPSILKEGKTCEEIEATLKEAGFSVDYVEDYDDRRLAAVWVDSIRLIDNIQKP